MVLVSNSRAWLSLSSIPSIYPTYHIRHGALESLSGSGHCSFSMIDVASSKITSDCLLIASNDAVNCGCSFTVDVLHTHPVQFSDMVLMVKS